ncbi:MAG: terminase family protein [Pseudomonadota bacterium]
MSEIKPTPYQSSCLSVPEEVNLFLCGGRGGAKTFCAGLDQLRHVEKYGKAARPLVIRESYKGVEEVTETLNDLYHAAYAGQHRINRNKGQIRLPNGAIVTLGILDGPDSWKQWQGKSHTHLFIDEAGLVKQNRWVNMLRSTLRAPDGIPVREIRAANPGGVSHAYLQQEFLNKAPAWLPYEIDGTWWVNCPSTVADNPHVDTDSYLRQLRTATKGDDALYRAWATGDWNIARGAYFHLLSEKGHMLAADFKPKVWPDWRPFVAGDYGSSAPCIVYVCARAPANNPLRLPTNSLVLLDELAIAEPDDINEGLKWPPGKIAESIQELCGRWGFVPRGVMDDFAGIDDSLLGFFKKEYNLRLEKPKKANRVAGWAELRELMHNSVERSGAPGFYASARCSYFWKTVPFLPRDENRPEDVDTSAADHAADAVRYALHYQPWIGGEATTTGMY